MHKYGQILILRNVNKVYTILAILEKIYTLYIQEYKKRDEHGT